MGPVRERQVGLVSCGRSAHVAAGGRRGAINRVAQRGRGAAGNRPCDESRRSQCPHDNAGAGPPRPSPTRLADARHGQDLGTAILLPGAASRQLELIGDERCQAGGARVETVHPGVRRRRKTRDDRSGAAQRALPLRAFVFLARTLPLPMVIR